ncbi:uncharacterized protein At5g43822 isoform X1 [Beta vulgaris subsp. vulgaris]|uniref:uncharacterized protein At5g43822 isoform X1 n=1 Tax=Beta vulgaris subsp. vulgaris TaxID=3555 RepID=UPI0020370C6C|nr:uncharacterized protein At5g43822 isoform X1 [Beta vulgaris subsp. vulgaris]
MEGILKKYQQKFKKVREEMDNWENLQSRLISQFSNASSIIQRLQVIGDKKNYGNLKGVDGIEDAVLQKQMESLENNLLSMKNTMEEFHKIVLSLEKMVRDSKQLLGGGSRQPSTKQLQQRMGIKPSISDCLDGLVILQEMHKSEYLLKTSVISALLNIAFKASSNDLGALRQLLVDQPNIPRDEVQFIFDIIFAENIC